VVALTVIAMRGRAAAGVIVAVIATNFAWAAACLIVAFGPMLAVCWFRK
jgi:hypothetical protein